MVLQTRKRVRIHLPPLSRHNQRKLRLLNQVGGLILATPDRPQSKTLILSTDVDQKSLETEFLIAICRPTGDTWQSKTLFLAIFDPCSSIS